MGWDASRVPVTGSRRWIVPFPPSDSLTISVPPSGLAADVGGVGAGQRDRVFRGHGRRGYLDELVRSVHPDRAACVGDVTLRVAAVHRGDRQLAGHHERAGVEPEQHGVAGERGGQPQRPGGGQRSADGPGLNVFVAMIAPVAASTRASFIRGGSCAAGESDQRKYRLPPVTVRPGLVKTRPTMPLGGNARGSRRRGSGGAALEARVLAGCWGRGLAQPVPTATSASTAAAAAHAAGNVLMPL